jgi:peptidoglycan/LPS O-acetylase OafA/YrhL
MTLSHPKYRADIDGLRAIAVLSVVGFHLFPNIMRGGFIGVDIFFVISGFLISSIIFENLERSSFSFLTFYTRRIKRIFPALILVLLTCFTLGWFFLLADEYAQLGEHIAGGAGFISNILLWRESGYFDAAAETKPLLHLWSLGIEEQFYIVWPLIIALAWRRNYSLTILVILTALSFFLSIKGLRKDPVAMFYLPHVRFWELLAGALLAHVTLYKHAALAKFPAINADAKSLLGAASIIVGLVTINKQSAFPGFWALLPVMGTMLLISAGSQACVNRNILTRRTLVWFGLISYPLYLWHWPLLSFVRIIGGGTPSKPAEIAAVLVSVALAWLTYRFIEKPIRTDQHSATKRNYLLLLMVFVGALGLTAVISQGFQSRPLPQLLQPYTESIALSEKRDQCFEIPFAFEKRDSWYCDLGNKNAATKIFAYGDSHALSLIPALEKLADAREENIEFTGGSGCPPLLGIQSMRGENWTKKYDCQKLNERIFAHVRDAHIPVVLLIARWSYYTGGTTRPEEFNALSIDTTKEATLTSSQAALAYGIEQTIARYHAIGVAVYIVTDNPQQLHNPHQALRNARQPSDTLINAFSLPRSEHEKNQHLADTIVQTHGKGATLINFDDILCDADMCPLVHDGKFLYADSDHLSIAGALRVYPRLSNALPK